MSRPGPCLPLPTMAAAAAASGRLARRRRQTAALAPFPRSRGESYVTLLNFVTGQSNAAAQGTAVALGSYHTVALLATEQQQQKRRRRQEQAPAAGGSSGSSQGGGPEYALYTMGWLRCVVVVAA